MTSKTCKENKLKEFQFKVIQRIVITKKQLFRFGINMGLTKNWARDAGFMFAFLSGMPETVMTTRALSGVSFQTKDPMECLVNRS